MVGGRAGVVLCEPLHGGSPEGRITGATNLQERGKRGRVMGVDLGKVPPQGFSEDHTGTAANHELRGTGKSKFPIDSLGQGCGNINSNAPPDSLGVWGPWSETKIVRKRREMRCPATTIDARVAKRSSLCSSASRNTMQRRRNAPNAVGKRLSNSFQPL
jgi:hypothetical protein